MYICVYIYIYIYTTLELSDHPKNKKMKAPLKQTRNIRLTRNTAQQNTMLIMIMIIMILVLIVIL